MFNYVILTTHSSHIYSMWDFTHMCNLTNLPLTCESVSLWASRPLYGSWISPTHSPLPNGFSLHQRVIHGSLIRHQWEPYVNPARTSMETPYVHVHRNLAPHHYLTPLAIFLCWAFFLFSSPGSLCVGHLGFLCPRWVGIMNTSLPSPHTTMGSDTTCWGE